MSEYRVLVCGDREWSDAPAIWIALQELRHEVFPDRLHVIHGACRGADLIAAAWAERSGVEQSSFPADWHTHGRKAGPIRNRQMLREGKPDLVLAFHDNIAASKGTKDMVSAATKANVNVKILTSLQR